MVSKELKEYINSRYSARAKEVTLSMNKATSEYKVFYKKEITQKLQQPIDALINKALIVMDAIKDMNVASTYHLENIIRGNVYQVNLINTSAIEKPFLEHIDNLMSEKDELLIRLSLEKDFDKINEMLHKYNIGL